VRHTQAHLTRAVLEGVAFGLRDSLELMRSAGLGAIQQVRVSGGGARSPLWRQILAGVLDVELATVNTTEGAAFGAALLAGVGAGAWPSVPAACAETVRIVETTQPETHAVSLYRQAYEIYTGLYPALKPSFHLANSLRVDLG
jgi:xylulokinase